MPAAPRDPGRRDGSPEADEHPEDEPPDAYERAQPDSQPTVSSEPEPDHEPADAG